MKRFYDCRLCRLCVHNRFEPKCTRCKRAKAEAAAAAAAAEAAPAAAVEAKSEAEAAIETMLALALQ